MSKKKKRPAQPTTGRKNTGAPGVCSVCQHKQVHEINAKILGRVRLNDLQEEYSVHRSSLSRHARKHLNHKLEDHFQHSRAMFNPDKDHIFIQWPNNPSTPEDVRGQFFDWHTLQPARMKHVTQTDIVISVYYPPALPRAPYVPVSAFTVEQAESEDRLRDPAKYAKPQAEELAAAFDPSSDPPADPLPN